MKKNSPGLHRIFIGPLHAFWKNLSVAKKIAFVVVSGFILMCVYEMVSGEMRIKAFEAGVREGDREFVKDMTGRNSQTYEGAETKFDMHHQNALRLMNEKKYPEALKELDEADKDLLGSPVSCHVRAVIYAEQGKFDLAEKQCLKGISNSTYYVANHRFLGHLYRKAGNLSAAIAKYREAVKIQSDDFESHRALIEALVADGKAAEASSYWIWLRKGYPGQCEALLEAFRSGDPDEKKIAELLPK